MEEDIINTQEEVTLQEESFHTYEGSMQNLIEQTGLVGLFEVCIALKALGMNKVLLNPTDIQDDYKIRLNVIDPVTGSFELELIDEQEVESEIVVSEVNE